MPPQMKSDQSDAAATVPAIAHDTNVRFAFGCRDDRRLTLGEVAAGIEAARAAGYLDDAETDVYGLRIWTKCVPLSPAQLDALGVR